MKNTDAAAGYILSSDVSIHLAFPVSHIAALEEDIQSRRFEIHNISFANCTTVDDFFTRISDEFDFPMKAVNTSSLISWLGNLEWRVSTKFVLIIENVHELATSNPGAFRVLMDILPFALDRQRSGGTSFHVFVTGMSDELVDRALYDLNDANSSLDGEDNLTVNPSYPVRIVVHTSHEK